MKALIILLTIMSIFITGCEKKEMAPDDINTKEKFVLIESNKTNDK
jgi:hypothetical protein